MFIEFKNRSSNIPIANLPIVGPIRTSIQASAPKSALPSAGQLRATETVL